MQYEINVPIKLAFKVTQQSKFPQIIDWGINKEKKINIIAKIQNILEINETIR